MINDELTPSYIIKTSKVKNWQTYRQKKGKSPPGGETINQAGTRPFHMNTIARSTGMYKVLKERIGELAPGVKIEIEN